MNALKVVDKRMDEVKIVINGAGAASIAIAKLLLASGARQLVLCDRKGAIYQGRTEGMNPVKEEMAKVINLEKRAGSLADMLAGADVFIGRQRPGGGNHRDGPHNETAAQSFLPAPTPPPKFSRKMPGPAGRRLSRPAAAITPTRSTMYWLFPASSAVPLTYGQKILTMK